VRQAASFLAPIIGAFASSCASVDRLFLFRPRLMGKNSRSLLMNGFRAAFDCMTA
jgi:hypothetical protein